MPEVRPESVAETRSRIMRAVKGKDTKPELTVRRILHGQGFRFRLHRRDLPGRPDIVLPRHQAVVFVHGCFWHQHEGCPRATLPRTRVEFWHPKLAGNRERDSKVEAALLEAGWKVIVVWECELRDHAALAARLADLVGGAAEERP